MKSTYKLLGVFWDGRPTLPTGPSVYKGILPRNYSCEYDLFDTISFDRSTKISDLLKIESSDAIQDMVKKVSECNKIVFVMNSPFESGNPIIQKIWNLRASQCLQYFHKQIPNAQIFLPLPTDDRTDDHP